MKIPYVSKGSKTSGPQKGTSWPRKRDMRKQWKTCISRSGQKTPLRPTWGILWLPENLGNDCKNIVFCNMSLVRGTQSPECIEYTTFGFRLNPLKTLGILAFLAAPACRATEMPAEALVSRAKSYVYQKTFQPLVTHAFSSCVSELVKRN